MASTRDPWRLGYRPALDGVRAIALLMVLFSHLLVDGRVGGLSGVTLFFVLSGFLITSLLLAEREQTGRISLRGFYSRRVRRLLPALLLTVVVVTAVQAAAGTPGAGWYGLAALSYVTNWIIIVTRDPLPALGHTWSLAVEEQFYLIWPALIVLLGRRKFLPQGLLAGVAVSLGIRCWFELYGGASTFRVAYGTDTRADALLLGCLLASVAPSLPRVPLRWSVMALITASVVTQYTPFGLSLGLFLVAFTGAVVVHGAAVDTRSWLTWGPLVRLGRISYGVYLFHRPLQSVAEWAGLPHLVAAATVFTVAIGLAEASYRYIELPIMRRRFARPRDAWASGCTRPDYPLAPMGKVNQRYGPDHADVAVPLCSRAVPPPNDDLRPRS